MKKDPHVDLKNDQTIKNRRRRKMRKKLERMMMALRSNFIFMNYVIFNSLIISYFIYFVFFPVFMSFIFYKFYMFCLNYGFFSLVMCSIFLFTLCSALNTNI
jgi:fatty acid desaturase